MYDDSIGMTSPSAVLHLLAHETEKIRPAILVEACQKGHEWNGKADAPWKIAVHIDRGKYQLKYEWGGMQNDLTTW